MRRYVPSDVLKLRSQNVEKSRFGRLRISAVGVQSTTQKCTQVSGARAARLLAFKKSLDVSFLSIIVIFFLLFVISFLFTTITTAFFLFSCLKFMVVERKVFEITKKIKVETSDSE